MNIKIPAGKHYDFSLSRIWYRFVPFRYKKNKVITGADISWDIPLGDFPGVIRTKKGIAYSRKLPRGITQPAPNSDDTE